MQHHVVAVQTDTFPLQKLALSIQADEWFAQKPPHLGSI